MDYPSHGGETIYEARPQGDGIFEDDERDHFLQQAYNAIVARVEPQDKGENSWTVEEEEDSG